MGRFLIVVVAFGLVTTASIVLWRRYSANGGSAAAAAAAPALSTEVARLRTEVEALRSRPPGAPLIVKYSAANDGASAPTPATSAAPGEESAEVKMERIERHAQATAEALDRRLLSEGRDASWGNEALARIDESVKSKLPNATLVESTCASTVCRVVLKQESTDDQRTVGSSLSKSPPFDQGTFYRYDTSSVPPKTTLYIIRSGHDLAELTGAETAQFAP